MTGHRDYINFQTLKNTSRVVDTEEVMEAVSLMKV